MTHGAVSPKGQGIHLFFHNAEFYTFSSNGAVSADEKNLLPGGRVACFFGGSRGASLLVVDDAEIPAARR